MIRPPDSTDAFLSALLEDDPQALYDQAPCGFLSTTPDGLIVKVNQTFLRWSGFSSQDLVGQRTFASLLTKGGQIYYDTHYAPMLLMQGGVREIALELVTQSGQRMPVLVNAGLVRGPEGEPLVFRVVVFDARERRQYEQELLRAKRQAEESEARARSLARTLQQALLPPHEPQIPGLDLAAAYQPATRGDEIAGDFYDIFQISEEEWVVTLGDVCGKGVDAAVLTSLVRHTLRAVTVRLASPAAALRALNDVLLRHETDRFCTVALLRLRSQHGVWQVTASLGGHPQPLSVTAVGAVAEMGTPGTLVGLFDDPRLEDSTFELEPGSTLLLYTDGVTEGRRGSELYGDQRLRDLVATHGGAPQQLVDALLVDVLDFQRGKPRDDIALVALGIGPPGGPGR